jgi:hypothetical protein
MMPEALDRLERDLRRATEAGQYDDVHRLATALCQAGAEHLTALPPQDPDGPRIAGRVMEVLDWALLMMLTARASCLDELNRVLVVNQYLHQADAPEATTSLRSWL